MMILDGATVLRGSRVLSGEAVVSGRPQSANTSAARTSGNISCVSNPSPRGPPPARVVAASTSGASWGGSASMRSPAGIFTRLLEKGVGSWRDDVPARDKNGQPSTKPLKINADLALYRARVCCYRARKSQSYEERKKLYAEASAAFQKALSIDGSDGRGFMGAAKLLEKEGRFDEARSMFEEGCRATNGENAFLWQAWAVLEERLGNPDRARQLYDAATVADKCHAAAWHGWGMLELRQGNYQRARDLLVKGLRLVPDDQPKEFLHQSLGVMAAERNRVDEARFHFKAGLSTPKGRQSGALWHAWALMEQRNGNLDEARRLFRLGLEACPKNRFIWLAWGALESDQGFPGRARELFREGAALNPKDAAILQAWARLEAAQGQTVTARALFDRAARVDPTHQPVWQAWGVMEFRTGNVDAARALFQRGVWANSRSKDAAKLFQAWGVLEDKQGNTGVARELFKCAIKADPSSVPSWHAWAQMEERLGAALRAAELRQLCLQERVEETVGKQDLSPAGLESMLRPVLDKVRSLLGGAEAGPSAAPAAAEAAGADSPLSADITSVASAAARMDSTDDQAVKLHVLSVIEMVAGARELAFNRRERGGGGGAAGGNGAGGGRQRFGSGRARKARTPLGMEAHERVIAARPLPPPLAAGPDAEIVFSGKLADKSLLRAASASAAAAAPAAAAAAKPAPATRVAPVPPPANGKKAAQKQQQQQTPPAAEAGGRKAPGTVR